MPQITDLNVAPYYDDFDKDDNFHRVLFRPGFAIQARELTQLQSIMQNQIERFAHGFKDLIIQKAANTTEDMQQYNPNYIGGDIAGGIQDYKQLFTRPDWSITPYATSTKGLYLCSSSTPPGSGVHGMCGYQAAKVALKRELNHTIKGI